MPWETAPNAKSGYLCVTDGDRECGRDHIIMRSSGYYVVTDSKPVKQKSELADSGPAGPVLLTKMATTQGVDIAAAEVYREDKTPYR